MFHEYCHHHVDKHELRHQYKNDEKHRSYAGGHTTVFHAVGRVVAVLAERVLHDAVPIVAGRYPEQRQERHAEVSEVSVFSQALTRVLFAALCKHEWSVLIIFLHGFRKFRFPYVDAENKNNSIISCMPLPSLPNSSTPNAANMKNNRKNSSPKFPT